MEIAILDGEEGRSLETLHGTHGYEAEFRIHRVFIPVFFVFLFWFLTQNSVSNRTKYQFFPPILSPGELRKTRDQWT